MKKKKIHKNHNGHGHGHGHVGLIPGPKNWSLFFFRLGMGWGKLGGLYHKKEWGSYIIALMLMSMEGVFSIVFWLSGFRLAGRAKC